jgi:hypothetical protein
MTEVHKHEIKQSLPKSLVGARRFGRIILQSGPVLKTNYLKEGDQDPNSLVVWSTMKRYPTSDGIVDDVRKSPVDVAEEAMTISLPGNKEYFY